jgi:hypothetical protein
LGDRRRAGILERREPVKHHFREVRVVLNEQSSDGNLHRVQVATRPLSGEASLGPRPRPFGRPVAGSGRITLRLAKTGRLRLRAATARA